MRRHSHDYDSPTMRVAPTPWDELTHVTDSMSQALTQHETNPRRRQAESDFATHRGCTIIAVSYCSHDVCFRLSDGSSLLVYLDDSGLRWKFDRAPTGIRISQIHEVGSTYLLWGDDASPWLWERENLLVSRIGRKVTLFSAGFVNVFLYCDGIPILRFGPLRALETSQDFLFWCETN